MPTKGQNASGKGKGAGKRASVGRPKRTVPVQRVQLTLPRETVRYIEDLMRLEIYGTSRPAVANYLILRGIEDLVGRRMLAARPAPQGD